MIVGARASDDCKRHWLCRHTLGCWRNALCGFAWALALAFCRQAAWRQGAVDRLRRRGLVEALELAQLKVVGPLPTVTTRPVLPMARSSFRVGMAIEDHSP